MSTTERMSRTLPPPTTGDAQRQARTRLMLRVLFAVLATVVVLALALAAPIVARGWNPWFEAEWRQPWVLLALVVVPFIWVWTIFAHDKFRPRLPIATVAPLRRGPRGFRTWLRDLPGVLRSVGVMMLIFALARPVLILSNQSADEKGIDIMLAMDLSGSMRAVLDADPKDLPREVQLKPGHRPTRLDAAKVVVQDFISRRKTDRIGTVVFGKSPYILSPATLDYQLLNKLVNGLSLGVIDGSATAIGDALGTAVARLEQSDALSKVVILLTDGDSNAGKYAPDYAVKLANRVGCKVYTVQIGSGDEVEVQSGYDLRGNPKYLKRRFPVNPELLQRIADRTGGQHFVATDAKGLAKSMHAILDQLEKTRFESTIAAHEELFKFLLIPGVVLVGFEALLRAWLLRRFP